MLIVNLRLTKILLTKNKELMILQIKKIPKPHRQQQPVDPIMANKYIKILKINIDIYIELALNTNCKYSFLIQN